MGIIRFLYRRHKRGQSVMETGILIIVIVSALIAMQVYLKRGIQGRMRSGVDSIGEQYDPQATTSDFTINHVSSVTTMTNTSSGTVSSGNGCTYFPDGTYTCTGSPGSGSTQNYQITDTTIQTHYDNTTKNGYEDVAKP